MQPVVLFQITPLDPQRLCPQVSRALEKRTELLSRQKYPKLWEWTDKLNRVEKVSQSVQKRRSKRRGWLGLVNWLLGTVLLTPALLEPQTLLVPLLVGAVGFGAGTWALWRTRRTLLAGLSLVMGVLFCAGALGNPAELGRLLALGIAGVVIGVAALLFRKREKPNPFDRAARQLLREKSEQAGTEHIRVAFSEEGITIGQEDREAGGRMLPYSDVTLVLETEDLLLPVLQGAMILLQKKDLLAGSLEELRALLSARTQYAALWSDPAV